MRLFSLRSRILSAVHECSDKNAQTHRSAQSPSAHPLPTSSFNESLSTDMHGEGGAGHLFLTLLGQGDAHTASPPFNSLAGLHEYREK
jgi:hypothetical protein